MSILTTLLCVVVGVFIAACIINSCDSDRFDKTAHQICTEMKMRS